MVMDRMNLRDLSFGGWASGVGHLLLILWLLSGWGLSHDPLDFQVTPVTAISGEDYARLVAATSPEAATDAAEAPVPPAADAPPPDASADAPPPEPAPQAPPETPADEAQPPPPPDPVPQPAEVQDAPPEMAVPEAFVPPPAPAIDARPQPRPADRIAAEAVAPPPPEADIAPEVQEEAAPAADAPVVTEEATAATAPEETATEIVTEAETPSGAPEVSLRPQPRPQRPAAPPPQEQPRPEPEQTQVAAAETPARPPAPDTSVEDALAAALAAEVASAPAQAAATGNPGPPMTGSERDAFRIAVSGCWAVDPGSEAAMVTITVGFDLDRQGRVVGNDVRLVTSSGGSPGAVDVAYQSARRAILRCQSQSGYQLPADKYEQWREVEMTFDPSGMRMR